MQIDSTKPSATVRFQLEGQIFTLVEDWRRAQRKIPSRPDAIRQLLERALGDAEQPGAAA
jgi:hypothetical protein